MTTHDVLAALDKVITTATGKERPVLALALAARMASLAASMAAITDNRAEGIPERWITPEEAARIARIEVRTLYDWAANKPWASRKTRRCLRIEEGAFRRWLSDRVR